MIQINHLYAAIPFELVANNEPAAATGDPSAILYRNGSASGVTVTVVATAVVGLYHCSFTTGSDWDKTDRLYLQASATVGGISDRKIIWDSFSEPDAVMRGTDVAATEAKQDTAKTAIDAILVDTDATIPGLIATAGSDATLAKQDEILAAVAAVEGSDATLAKQDAILAAVGAIEPSLTGPFTRTITVTDSVSGNPIEGVSVRLSLAADTESKLTNASGVASFTVSTGTWSYEVFRSGYAGASGTVEVSASGNTGVTLVASVVSVADAPLCAVTLPIKDQYGQPLPTTMVTLTFAGVTAGAAPAGIVMSPPPVQASDSAGIVQVNLIRLAKYTATYRIGTQTRQVSFTVPDEGSFLVTEV